MEQIKLEKPAATEHCRCNEAGGRAATENCRYKDDFDLIKCGYLS